MGCTPRTASSLDATSQRPSALLGLLAVLVLLAAGCGSGDDRNETGTAWRVADCRLVGRWETIAVSARAEIEPGLAVMDHDTRLVAVRSINGGHDVAAYVYDSAPGTASHAAPSGFGWRGTTTVVWTGKRVLVIGGSSGTTDSPPWPAYDPVADVWEELEVDRPPDGVRVGRGGVWTGTEVVFVGAGVALDPQTGSWRVIAASPLAERLAATVVWTGEEIIVWGGCDASIPQCDDFGKGLFADGAIYQPSTDSWRVMAPSPLPPGNRPSAAWTGTEVLYHAGLVEPDAAASAPGGVAASYDPARDRWSPLPDPPLAPRQGLGLAWSNSSRLLFAWGGSTGFNDGDQSDDGAAFDPSTETWLTLPDAPPRSARHGHSVATMEDALYVDGGWPSSRPMVLTPD